MSAISSGLSPFPPAMGSETITMDASESALMERRQLGKTFTHLSMDRTTRDISIYMSMVLRKKALKDDITGKLKKERSFLTKDYLIFLLNLQPSSFTLRIHHGALRIDRIFKTLSGRDHPKLISLSLITDRHYTPGIPKAFSVLLQRCPVLRNLTLEDTFSGWPIEDESAEHFALTLSKMTSLSTISFVNIRMSEKASTQIFQGLAASTNQLVSLKLERPDMSEGACRAISCVLISQSSLEKLSLIDAPLNQAAICSLLFGLRAAPSLSSLDLSGQRTDLDEVMGKALSSLLSTTTSLTALTLPTIQTQGLIALKDGLAENSTLSNLRLCFVGKTDKKTSQERADAISEVIGRNTTLTDLSLFHFSIQNQWEKMADALISNRSLSALTIAEYNYIMGDDDSNGLARVLANNFSLCTLNLGAVRVSEEGFCAIARSVHHNIALSHFTLPTAAHSERTILELSHMLKDNQALEQLSVRGESSEPRSLFSLTPLAEALSFNSRLRDLSFSVPASLEELERFILLAQNNLTLTDLRDFIYFQGDFYDTYGTPETIREPLERMLFNNRLRMATLFGQLFHHFFSSELT